MSALLRRISCGLALNICLTPNSLVARIAITSDFFEPRLDEILAIRSIASDPIQAIDHDQGTIVVNPPKGSCFVIRKKGPATKDFMACKKAVMPFKYEDLDNMGKLQVDIFQDGSDLGTPISWQTPYRFGKYIEVFNDKFRVPVVIRSCKYEIDPILGRKVTLNLAGNITWRILFPDVDRLQPQPTSEKPNLYVQQGLHEGGFIKVESQAQKSAREKTSSEQQADMPDESNPDFIASPWQIHPRGAYQMSGANFKSDDPPPLQSKSVCRYKYPETDDQNTHFECRNVHRFKWVYLELSCLKKPK